MLENPFRGQGSGSPSLALLFGARDPRKTGVQKRKIKRKSKIRKKSKRKSKSKRRIT
jgi:hypothetical protein